MEVHDRGTMKWVSLMLPEHVAKLQEIFIEKKERPLLDEQKMNEMDRLLKEALTYQKEIQLTYYADGDFHVVQGVLAKIDQQKGYIMLCDGVGEAIPLSDLVDVEVVAMF